MTCKCESVEEQEIAMCERQELQTYSAKFSNLMVVSFNSYHVLCHSLLPTHPHQHVAE